MTLKGKGQGVKGKEKSRKICSPDYYRLTTGYWSRGFTLLEVLVASAILSVVFVILYGVFSQTLTVKRHVEQQTAVSRAARVVLQRIAEDVQASFPFAPENTRFRGETRRTSAFPQSSFSFLSFAPAQLTNSSHEGDWSEITYALVPDPSDLDLWQLVRWVRFESGDVQTSERERTDGEAMPLLAGVRGFCVRFFDGRAWLEEWGPERTPGRIPQAVEIELILVAPDRRQEKRRVSPVALSFSTMVDVPLARSTVRRTVLGGES